jgi:hypothetical protein
MIPLKFRNKPAILVATGPSLTEEVVDTIRKYRDKFIFFGCNDSYKIIDFLDVHYACDKQWWVTHGEDFRKQRPKLESWTQHKESAEQFNLNYTPGTHTKDLSLNSNSIHFGSNSGYQLLNIAFLMGCNKFILVGYNMQVVRNKRHFFGDHPQGLNNSSPYSRFVQAYKTINPEIAKLIVNCTPNSALIFFNQTPLEEELKKYD